jgi:hypothetical protein
MRVILAVVMMLLAGEARAGAAAGAGALRSAGFAVDALWPLEGSLGGVDRLLGVDFAYRRETPAYFLVGRFGVRAGGNLSTDGHSALDVSILDARIGRHLTRGEVAPFVHAGAGLHWCRAEENVGTGVDPTGVRTVQDEGVGLALMGGGGVTAFRTKRLALELMVEYTVTLVDLDSGGMPQGFLCSVSVRRGAGGE